MKALLDANVLYPTVLREILTGLAVAGLYEPLWSPRILAEWRHAAARLGADQDAIAGAEIALLTDRFPAATMPDDGLRCLDLDLPDPDDRHVLEAALAGDAVLIVTANMRDFPPVLMRRLGLQAVHPDAFLLDCLTRDPGQMQATLRLVRDRAVRAGGDLTIRQMLKRSRLPRLARALNA